jgi:hypothetical protein
MTEISATSTNDVLEDSETIPVGDDWDSVVDTLKSLSKLGLTPESQTALNQMIVTFQGPGTHGPKGTKRIPKPHLSSKSNP